MARFTKNQYYALLDYLTEKVYDALSDLEDENNVQVIHQKFPDYNPSWCIEDFDTDDIRTRNELIGKIADYLASNLFYYYNEDENI